MVNRSAIGACCVWLWLSSPANGQDMQLAVTIDDVPWTAAHAADSATVARGTADILAALARHGVPAVGFAVCDAMELHPGATAEWLHQGLELGNHTQSHRDIDRGLVPWLRDVRSCADQLSRLAPQRYFRYPMLHRGASQSEYRQASALLDSLGLTVAPVTLDNSEWLLARGYQSALAAGDQVLQRLIADGYLDHMKRVARQARRTARDRFGRDVPHILLLHANQLNADHLDRLLSMLVAEFEARFITLDQALADPVYRLPDGYRGSQGLSWLYRAEPASPDLAEWDERQESRLRALIAPD